MTLANRAATSYRLMDASTSVSVFADYGNAYGEQRLRHHLRRVSLFLYALSTY